MDIIVGDNYVTKSSLREYNDRPARVVCTDGNFYAGRTVLALVTDENGKETVLYFDDEGETVLYFDGGGTGVFARLERKPVVTHEYQRVYSKPNVVAQRHASIDRMFTKEICPVDGHNEYTLHDGVVVSVEYVPHKK